jgi:hypothetical protein
MDPARTTLFTATDSAGNGVSRCTAIALGLVNSKIFVADAGAKKIRSMGLSGSGLAALAAATNSVPTSLAVDPASRQVYFTASSAARNFNSIQRVSYDGSGVTTVFTASSGVVHSPPRALRVFWRKD